jgi:hypothetical protein
MATPSSHKVTQLLQAWSEGDLAALDQLVPLVYGELRRLISLVTAMPHPALRQAQCLRYSCQAAPAAPALKY